MEALNRRAIPPISLRLLAYFYDWNVGFYIFLVVNLIGEAFQIEVGEPIPERLWFLRPIPPLHKLEMLLLSHPLIGFWEFIRVWIGLGFFPPGKVASPIWIAFYLIYYLVCWTKWGATLGQLLSGLQVVSKGNRPVRWYQAFIRYLLCVTFVYTFFIGFLWILIDKERRGLQDRISGTIVVFRESNEIPPND